MSSGAQVFNEAKLTWTSHRLFSDHFLFHEVVSFSGLDVNSDSILFYSGLIH